MNGIEDDISCFERPRRTDDGSGEVVVFRTPLAVRLGEWVLAGFSVLVGIGLAVLPALFLGLVLAMAHGSEIPSLVAAGGVLVLGAIAGWLMVRGRLRFRLTISPTAIVLGGGRNRAVLDPDDIDEINEDSEPAGRVTLGLGCQTHCFYLARRDVAACIAALSVCRHAIFVDRDGSEHASNRADDPRRVLRNYARTQRRRSRRAIFCAVTAGWPGPFLVWGLWRAVASGEPLPLRALFLLLDVFLCVMFLVAAARFRRDARRAEEQLAEMPLEDEPWLKE